MRELQTQGRGWRDVQGRDKREGQMETVKCGRVRERVLDHSLEATQSDKSSSSS